MSMGMERIPSELQRMLDTQAATLATTFTNALDAFADRFEQMLSHAKIRWTRQERQRLNLSNARLRQLRNTRITSSPATCTINPSDFISLVGVPPLTAMDDIRVASQHRFDQRSIGQVNSITGQASFGYWIYDKTSSFLLVEACLPNAPKLSAMSLFCAQFAQNISKAQAGVSLVHFCGKHLYQDERLDGPVGLIRNLITQLVVYLHAVHEVHLDHLFDDEDCHRAAEGDLDALWDLFRQLLCEVPADVPVFCIIDGISFIGNSWRDETQKLVRYLHDMVDDDAVDAMFKVLLTCPSRLTTDMPFISSERRIRLSPGDSAQRPDMHQAFNEMTRVVFSSNLQSKDRVDSGIGVEEEELPWQPKGSEF